MVEAAGGGEQGENGESVFSGMIIEEVGESILHLSTEHSFYIFTAIVAFDDLPRSQVTSTWQCFG